MNFVKYRQELRKRFRFLVSMLDFDRSGFVKSSLFLLVTALSEGIGLLLLVPMLNLLGITGGPANNSVYDYEIISGIRDYFSSDTELALPAILALFVIVITVQSVFKRHTDMSLAKFTIGYVDNLRNRLYRALIQSRFQFFSKRRSSDLLHVLTGQLGRIEQATHSLMRLVITITLIGVYAVLSLYISATLTVITLIIAIALLGLLRPRIRKSRELGEMLNEKSRLLYQTLNESISGMRIAKMQTREGQFIEDFVSYIDQTRQCQISYQSSSSVARMWFRIGAALSLALLVLASMQLESVTTAQLLVLIVIFARVMPMVMELQQSYLNAQFLLPAYDVVNCTLQECLNHQESVTREDSNTVLNPLMRQVKLVGICFGYQNGDALLDNINLILPARSTTIIRGPSGAGKSTLIDILVGLLIPDTGKIYCDGQEINDSNRRQWRSQIAYVPQDVYLYHNTLRFNLTWGDPDIDERSIWAVLEKVAAKEFVQSLPSGLDTYVGDRGSHLSGGERQRIALARALLQRPALLVLDEATSAIDQNNQRLLQQTLNELQGHITIIVVTHQLHEFSNFDKVITLENGKLVSEENFREKSSREAFTQC